MTEAIGSYATVKGIEDLIKKMEAKQRNIEKAVAVGVNRAADHVRNTTIKKIRNVGKGKVYKRGKSVTHQASKPGDPPAWDYGKLVAGFKVINATPGPVCSAKFASTTEYGPALEYGTKKIQPRPFMQPTQQVVQECNAMLKVELEAAVKA